MQRRKMGDPPETLGNHTAPPKHVVCTVHPQITVEEFVSVIDTSCQQNKVEDTNIVERDESTSGKEGKLSDDGAIGMKQSNNENRTATQKCMDKVLPDSSSVNEVKDLFLLAGLHTCADLGPTMLRVFAKCPTAHALVSVACCYMKMSCAVKNSLIKCKAQLKPDDSMQTGGLFAEESVNIGKFQSYPTRKLFDSNEPDPSASASNSNQNTENIAETKCNSVKGIPGFPMSEWVKGQEGCDLDFEPLELACHAFDVYHNRLKGKKI